VLIGRCGQQYQWRSIDYANDVDYRVSYARATYSVAEEGKVFVVDFGELLKLYKIDTPLAEFAF
jgi:hypothetical protein